MVGAAISDCIINKFYIIYYICLFWVALSFTVRCVPESTVHLTAPHGVPEGRLRLVVLVVVRPGAVLAIVALPEFVPARVAVRSGVAPIGPVAAVAAGVGGSGVDAVASLQRRIQLVCQFLDGGGELSVGSCEIGVGGGEVRDGLGERVECFVLRHRRHGQGVEGLAEISLHFLADKALVVGASNGGICGEAGLSGGQLVDCVHVVECVT